MRTGSASSDFRSIWTAGTVTCPARAHRRDQRPPRRAIAARASRAAMCRDCPLSRGAALAGHAARSRSCEHERPAPSRARSALRTLTRSEHLRRTRPRIERLLGLLANRYGARKSRYIGSAKGTIASRWAAALVNLNPIGQRIAAQSA